MKKSFLVFACAVLSMSIFAQTPQAAGTSKKTKPAQQSAQAKQDPANPQSSKEALTKDKGRKKADKASKASTQTKKKDKKQVITDKVSVKASKKTEKNVKKTAPKKTKTAYAAGDAGRTPTR